MPVNDDKIHHQGDEWLVAFTYATKRYSLGLFPTRREAEHALARKLAALESATAARGARSGGSLPAAAGGALGAASGRAKDGLVAAEARVPVAMLARLVKYDLATGGMVPRPRVRGRAVYLSLEVAGVRVYAHRAAWAIVHGEWPARRLRCLGHVADLRLANWRMAGDVERA